MLVAKDTFDMNEVKEGLIAIWYWDKEVNECDLIKEGVDLLVGEVVEVTPLVLIIFCASDSKDHKIFVDDVSKGNMTLKLFDPYKLITMNSHV